MKTLKTLLLVLSLAATGGASAREIFVNVDFYDEIHLVWHRDKRGYTAADATNLLTRIRATGAVGINLRTASIGITFGLDGMFIHEAMSLETIPGGFEAAAEMNRRFKAVK